MPARNVIVSLLAVSTLLFLAGCGSSNGTAKPVAPPSGSFSNSDLNGTYVFSVSGTDSQGAPYAVAGTLTANGSGGNGKGSITGGTLDINDIDTSVFTSGPIAGASISSSSTYSVSTDGRGQAVISTNVNGLGNLTFDFVLSSSSHGLITEFDDFGTGSGTIDAQTASVTPSGAYAFSFSGATYGDTAFAAAGNFTVGGGGAISTGLADFNNNGAASYTNLGLSGTVVAGPSSTPGSTLTTSQYPGLIFDVIPVTASQLKFIEMDTTATLSGDAFSQPTTTLPSGTLAFTLQGELTTGGPIAAGGFMVTDSTGDITNASTEDYNVDGTLSPATPAPFSGTYAAAGTGRYTLSGFSGFTGGSTYVAYPSSGGLLLLEIDTDGITLGAAYTQTSTTLATGQGYGLNFSGYNLSADSEVDDIAEFTASSSGGTITGLVDENSTVDGPATFSAPLESGTFSAPVSGRGTLAATVGTSSSNTTLNGGFGLIFYTVDGTTFPFIEADSGGQVSAGVFVEQNPSSASSAIARPSLFVPRPLVHAHQARRKKN